MQHRASLIFVLSTLLLSGPALATADDHDPRLILALSAFHADPPAEALDFLGEARVPALLSVARDEGVMRLARIRAISLLVRADGDVGRTFASGVVTDGRWPVRLRIAAVRAFSNYQTSRASTTALLGRALGDPDAGVRETAVRGLALQDTPAALALLDAQRGRERHVAVRVALRDALQARSPGALPPEGRFFAGPRASATTREHPEVTR